MEQNANAVIAAVSERVNNSAPDVREKLITTLSDRQIQERVELLDAGLKKLKELDVAIKKIKPDHIVMDAKGAEISSGYSKAVVEELKKAQEAHQKMEEALNLALDKNDFSKLKDKVK